MKDATERAERTIGEMHLATLHEFVIPGSSGCLAAAQLHVCRAVCRRAERCVVHAITGDNSLAVVIPLSLRDSVLAYMNRCSDLLFACAIEATEKSKV